SNQQEGRKAGRFLGWVATPEGTANLEPSSPPSARFQGNISCSVQASFGLSEATVATQRHFAYKAILRCAAPSFVTSRATRPRPRCTLAPAHPSLSDASCNW